MGQKRLKPGKPPRIPDEEIFESLKKYYVFDEDGSVLPLSDPVWKMIMDQEGFGGKIKPYTLQAKVAKSRNELQDKLREFHGLNKQKCAKYASDYSGYQDFGEKYEKVNEDSMKYASDCSRYQDSGVEHEKVDKDSDYSVTSDITVDEIDLPVLKFDVHITKDNWYTMKPVKMLYNDNRLYDKLQGPWTDIVHLAIEEEMHLPCDFAFKRETISKSSDRNYLTINGTCRDPNCGAEVTGICRDEPTSDDTGITINIITSDTRDILHGVKRPCRGEERQEIKRELLRQKAAPFREHEADKLMTFGELEPARLRKETTYRKMRQEAKNEDCGSKKPNDIVKAFLALISASKTIRNFSMALFHLWYWTQQQIDLWNLLRNDKKTPISIDASGRFVKKVVAYGVESPYIFLYVIVTNIGGKLSPLLRCCLRNITLYL